MRDEMKHSLVTIITPTYNRAHFLEETIESVLNQDYPCIQYIVVDDGSTDATPELLARYDDRLTVVRHDNHGQAWSINRGFDRARGEYLCIVNSDDPLPQGAIRPLVDALCANPDVVLVYPDYEVVDDEGHLLLQVTPPDYSYIDMIRWFLCMPGPGAVFRRTLVERAGGWDPACHFCPDFEWYVRAGLVGPFLHIRENLAQWRQHEGSITTTERGVARANEYSRVMEIFFARDDLPAEVRAVEAEAFRSAFITAAMTMDQDPNATGHRFAVSDCLGALLSNPESRKRPTSRTKDGIIMDLQVSLGESWETIQRLAAAIEEQQKGIEWLRAVVAERDARIASDTQGIEWLRGIVAEQQAGIEWLRGVVTAYEAPMPTQEDKAQ